MVVVDPQPSATCSNHLNLPILNIHHPLRVGITKIAIVRQPQVDFGLVQGVCDLIREDTRR